MYQNLQQQIISKTKSATTATPAATKPPINPSRLLEALKNEHDCKTTLQQFHIENKVFNEIRQSTSKLWLRTQKCRTERRTERWTDGRTDGRTTPKEYTSAPGGG
ncbi:hypothetical protein DPMN_033534 [Dreissena polymorpha]|uniref:Uncharacterized protein n=1 Tax=Dreissena polymorpha TaxID=45954 RepID=A0A9D4M3U4_DREPO|nr:hypothetical protein DPMN_033534 [Dreissena polymorpha]